MNNNEPDTLPDPAIGYIFQNDIVALKQAFSLPDIDYADISQREQLAAALKRWPLLAEFAGNDSNLLIVFYVQIMPDDFVMQLHRF